MPCILDYSLVSQTLTAQGLRCLHYNGGIFGFPPGESVRHEGWLIGDDPTLTAAARQSARMVLPPTVATLADGLVRRWQADFPGELWILPGSHWAYELTFGGKRILADLLNSMDLDCDSLVKRTTADAVVFSQNEAAAAELFLTGLLQMLQVTDFAAIFPEHRVTALLHHHHQVWWTLPPNQQNQASSFAGP